MSKATTMANAPQEAIFEDSNRLYQMISSISTRRYSVQIPCIMYLEKSTAARIHLIKLFVRPFFCIALSHAISAPSAMVTEILVSHITIDGKLISVAIFRINDFRHSKTIPMPLDPGDTLLIEKISDGKKPIVLFARKFTPSSPINVQLELVCSGGIISIKK